MKLYIPWRPFAWTLHNVFAHPLSEILFLLGLHRASNWLHDVTLPPDGKDAE